MTIDLIREDPPVRRSYAADVIEALRATGGEWYRLPQPVMGKALSLVTNADIEVRTTRDGRGGKPISYARLAPKAKPAAPTNGTTPIPASPPPKPVDLGLRFECEDCDATAPSPTAMQEHTLHAHQRRATKGERTPVRRTA